MMDKKRWAMLTVAKKEWLKVCPTLTNNSGIYILTRTDENSINYAYVGQSVHILQRLAEHKLGYQHIDSSIKKRKLYNKETNPYGWNVDFFEFPKEQLDDKEQEYIQEYMKLGYQLRYNKTLGSQGVGKESFGENTLGRYRKGVDYGKEKAISEIKVYFDKYLDVIIKGKPNKIKERKLQEFKELLGGEK